MELTNGEVIIIACTVTCVMAVVATWFIYRETGKVFDMTHDTASKFYDRLEQTSVGRNSPCPYPVDGNDTVGKCMDAGWCGCENGPKLEPGYKPCAAGSPTVDGEKP